MSRSGYDGDCDYYDELAMGRWLGQVASATRGKRGQAFFRDLVEALEMMPEKRLIRNELRKDGEVCALGALGAKRGINLESLAPAEPEVIAQEFGVAHQLIREVVYQNDEVGFRDTPERRWERLYAWAKSNLKVQT